MDAAKYVPAARVHVDWNLGLCDLGTLGLFYFWTLGLLETSRPFDFGTLGLYAFGLLDCLICRFLDFVDFYTFGLLDFGTFRLWDLGLWNFGTFLTFRLWDFGIFNF